jgi:hypothetical protein
MLATLMPVRKDRDTKAELNRRSQACEVLAGTGISRRVKMVRAGGIAPPWSCSRSKRLTFRLRSEELLSALNPISGHYFDRARSLPTDRVQLREKEPLISADKR